MSYDDDIFMVWHKARAEFVAENPATAKALALKIPSPTGDEHIASGECWCCPELSYVDPDTGVSVFVHRRIQ